MTDDAVWLKLNRHSGCERDTGNAGSSRFSTQSVGLLCERSIFPSRTLRNHHVYNKTPCHFHATWHEYIIYVLIPTSLPFLLTCDNERTSWHQHGLKYNTMKSWGNTLLYGSQPNDNDDNNINS